VQRYGRGVALAKLNRGGEEIPFAPETLINRGDLLRLGGATRDVARAGKALGYLERPSSESDIVFHSLGIVIGQAIEDRDCLLRIAAALGEIDAKPDAKITSGSAGPQALLERGHSQVRLT
jgi:hypothetical protein